MNKASILALLCVFAVAAVAIAPFQGFVDVPFSALWTATDGGANVNILWVFCLQ